MFKFKISKKKIFKIILTLVIKYKQINSNNKKYKINLLKLKLETTN